MPHREKSHAWRSSLKNQRQNKTHPSPPVHKLNAQNSVSRKVGSVSRLFYFAFFDATLIEDSFVVCFHSHKQRADIISIPVSMHFSFI